LLARGGEQEWEGKVLAGAYFQARVGKGSRFTFGGKLKIQEENPSLFGVGGGTLRRKRVQSSPTQVACSQLWGRSLIMGGLQISPIEEGRELSWGKGKKGLELATSEADRQPWEIMVVTLLLAL